MKKGIVLVFILTILFSIIPFANAAPSEKIPVIIGFKDSPNSALVQAHGGDVKIEYAIIPAIACDLPQQAIDALKKNPGIAYIEEDAEVFAVDDELTASWGVEHIGAGTVHSYGNTGFGIDVAVIDTGIDYRHKDLDGNYRGGYDFVNRDSDPMDDNGHGTHCAGIIAAEDDGIGVVGVAPEASLWALKVLNRRGSGLTSNIVLAIQWATDPAHKMDVISMSLGSSTGTTSLQQACDAAYAAGIVVVAAAGNNGASSTSSIIYPARYPSVIAVGATDKNDVRASFSSTGPQLELVAPGVSILSTYIYVSGDGLYRDTVTMSGTSMACPHVAGTAALVLASPADGSYDDGDGVWEAVEVREKLKATADKPLADYSNFNYYGFGLVDANGAADSSAVDTLPPTISELSPAEGAFVKTATPVISARVTDVSGVASVTMRVDGATVSPAYDGVTGLVEYTPSPLSEGSHSVSLTATDTKGYYDIQEWSFTVDTTYPAQSMHVANIEMSSDFRMAGKNKFVWGVAEAKIVDASGQPVSGVTVYGQWSDATADSDSGTTDLQGVVSFTSDSVKNPKSEITFTFAVTNVVLTGWTYEAAANLETSDSITVK